jgi:hypothetical protein
MARLIDERPIMSSNFESEAFHIENAFQAKFLAPVEP